MCKDRKLIVDIGQTDDQYPNGKVVRCPRCYRPQEDTHLIRRLTQGNGLSKAEQTYTITQLHKETGNQKAIAAVQQLLNQQTGIVYLWSANYGNGKTHLLAAAVNHCTNNGVHAIYTTMHKLLDYLRAGFDKDKRDEHYEARLQNLCTCKLLAIDDIERFRGTGFEIDQAENIMAERYRTAAENMTLIAGRTNPAKLPDFLASRYGPYATAITGASWRGRP